MVTMRWNSLETAATGRQSPAWLGLEAKIAAPCLKGFDSCTDSAHG